MNKFKPNIPTLMFSGKDSENKKMISLRLPESLIEELKKVAEKKGWSQTQLIQVVLDQYCQYEKKKS